MHISEQVAAELFAQGWTPDGPHEYTKRIAHLEAAGSLSNGTRVARICIDENGRWVDRIDGWGATQKTIDLRDFRDNPKGAVEAVLKPGTAT